MEHQQGGDQIDQVEDAILKIGWLVQRRFMHLLASDRFDLTVPQFYTLQHLSAINQECNMSDLARATHQSAASLTGVIDRLLEKGLVERGRSDGDRRQVIVQATEQGRDILKAIDQAHHDDMRTALNALSEADINEFLRLSQAVIAGMLRCVERRRC